jgi:hypothetical protein
VSLRSAITAHWRPHAVTAQRGLHCATLLLGGVFAVPRAAATTAALTRNPYLTDAAATSVRVNWATSSTGTAKVVIWGPAGGTCNQYSATGAGSPFTFGSTNGDDVDGPVGQSRPELIAIIKPSAKATEP